MKVRPIKVIKNYIPHAEGSCLISMGNTTVLCAATVEDRVPQFIENDGLTHGWVTAEYSMLPRAGKQRTPRQRGAHGGRSQEISRLIGRSLRGIIDLEKLGKRSIVLDCDVIKADGGTRTASINGSFIALCLALKKLYKEKIIDSIPVKDYLGAVSVGISKGKKVLDLCAEEDNGADVDMNVVMTGSGHLVEIQGTAEKVAFTRRDLDKLIDMAQKGIKEIIKYEKRIIGPL
jgi:ribonuclease PH